MLRLRRESKKQKREKRRQLQKQGKHSLTRRPPKNSASKKLKRLHQLLSPKAHICYQLGLSQLQQPRKPPKEVPTLKC